MIEYLKNAEIDREQWDTCIEASQSSKPYPYSWYLDIMAPGWEALVDDDYDSVFPLPVFSKFGFNYITTPIFLQQLGAFSPDKPATGMIHEFIYYLPEFYKFIDLCVGQELTYKGFKVMKRSNFELDLSMPYEKIWDNFSSDCRRNIQIAAKKKFEPTNKIKPDELIELFIRNKGFKLKGIKPRDYEKLKNLMNFCTTNNKGKLTGIRDSRKKLIFGMFQIEVPGSITVLFTANSTLSREKRAGYYILNEIIKENAGSQTILDFAGSSIPSVASFMESFGSTDNPYYRIYRNSLPWPVSMFK